MSAVNLANVWAVIFTFQSTCWQLQPWKDCNTLRISSIICPYLHQFLSRELIPFTIAYASPSKTIHDSPKSLPKDTVEKDVRASPVVGLTLPFRETVLAATNLPYVLYHYVYIHIHFKTTSIWNLISKFSFSNNNLYPPLPKILFLSPFVGKW